MKVQISFLLLIFLLVFWLPSSAVDKQYEVTKALYKGWIKGRVTHTLHAVEAPKLEIDRDKKVCGEQPRSIQAVDIGSDGALRNAVVYIKDISSGKAFTLPANPPILTQDHCDFQPHVQLVPPMSSIKILNHDNILHGVHAFQFDLGTKFVIYPNSVTYPARTLFNIAMVAQRKETFQQLGGPGIVKFICEAGHYWMTAYFVVTPHPYFVKVNDDGSFLMEDVPPGKYTLVSWHEYFGTKEQTIQVKENQPVVADFAYTEEL